VSNVPRTGPLEGALAACFDHNALESMLESIAVTSSGLRLRFADPHGARNEARRSASPIGAERVRACRDRPLR
jgi:hypothetical protein